LLSLFSLGSNHPSHPWKLREPNDSSRLLWLLERLGALGLSPRDKDPAAHLPTFPVLVHSLECSGHGALAQRALQLKPASASSDTAKKSSSLFKSALRAVDSALTFSGGDPRKASSDRPRSHDDLDGDGRDGGDGFAARDHHHPPPPSTPHPSHAAAAERQEKGSSLIGSVSSSIKNVGSLMGDAADTLAAPVVYAAEQGHRRAMSAAAAAAATAGAAAISESDKAAKRFSLHADLAAVARARAAAAHARFDDDADDRADEDRAADTTAQQRLSAVRVARIGRLRAMVSGLRSHCRVSWDLRRRPHDLPSADNRRRPSQPDALPVEPTRVEAFYALDPRALDVATHDPLAAAVAAAAAAAVAGGDVSSDAGACVGGDDVILIPLPTVIGQHAWAHLVLGREEELHNISGRHRPRSLLRIPIEALASCS
jgi:hypothetical protein